MSEEMTFAKAFSFFDNMGNYQDRKIGRYDNEDHSMFVSTAAVCDSNYPYETAVKAPEYNSGDMIIVENYATKEEAKAGHIKWVELMTSQNPPNQLIDVGEAGIQQLCSAFGETDEDRIHKRQDVTEIESE